MTVKLLDLRLYLIADLALLGTRSAESVIMPAVRGGVTLVQLRGKQASGRALHMAAQTLMSALAGSGVKLIINDNIAVAQAVGAAGVHLGQDDLPFGAARHLLGPDAIIGASAGTAGEAELIDPTLVDYVGIGPVYGSTTKGDAGPAIGPAGFSAVRRLLPLPAVAIGNIRPGNAAAVLRQGANGVAVASALCCVSDPEQSAQDLRAIIAEAAP